MVVWVIAWETAIQPREESHRRWDRSKARQLQQTMECARAGALSRKIQ